MKSKEPATLIGIQDAVISRVNRCKGPKRYVAARAARRWAEEKLTRLGFTPQQADAAVWDALDVAGLERLAEESC